MLRHAILTEARDGLRQNQFFLMFEPRLDAAHRDVIGFDAHLRWQHPRSGLLTPAHFMADLEMSDVSPQIVRFILTETIQRIADWQAQGFGTRLLSVTLAGTEIMREGFSSQVAHMLKWHEIDPARLEICLTERTDFAVLPRLDVPMRELQQQGLRVALDDFGTGFASLGVFRRLPFNTVKLDPSFMAGVPVDFNSRSVVETFVDLCAKVGRQPVVKGVESMAQLEWLGTLHNVHSQGYGISPPVRADDVETILAAADTTAER